jgi:hypothetical protein
MFMFALLGLGCSAAGVDAEQHAVATDCLALAPAPELDAQTRVAAERWSVATGCNISVGEAGIPVVLVDRIAKGIEGRFAVDPADGQLKIRLLRGLSGERLQHVLDHEMGHGLGVPSTHTADGLMQSGSGMAARITAGNLEVVCSVSHCATFSPE